MESRAEKSISEQDRIGKEIAEVFGLKKNKHGQYITGYGNKTATGVFNMVLVLNEKIKQNRDII